MRWNKSSDRLEGLKWTTSEFSPIVLLAGDIGFEEYIEYIQMGFDDIISLPESREMIVARLSNELGHEIEYFETPDYFGPDRRRLEVEPPSGVQRAAMPHSHERIVFTRDPHFGIKIIKRVVHLALIPSKASNPSRPPANANWSVKS